MAGDSEGRLDACAAARNSKVRAVASATLRSKTKLEFRQDAHQPIRTEFWLLSRVLPFNPARSPIVR